MGTSKTEKWANITNSTNANSPEWLNKLNLPKGGRIASYNDYAALFKSEVIEQGYGVLYGDEASEQIVGMYTNIEARVRLRGEE